jgi:hypothetical protein
LVDVSRAEEMKVLSRKILVIPRGWRKMRTGTIFRKGDLWIFSDMDDDVWYEPFHGNEGRLQSGRHDRGEGLE